MLQEDEVAEPVDGRVARRERNIAAVLEVVIDMYTEDLLFPTIEQVSKRSGLSLRSLYRYFADPGELHDAAIQQHRKKTSDVAHLPAIGEGPLSQRIDDFVAMRVELYEVAAPAFRASVHCAGTNSQIRENVERTRKDLSDQFGLQFATELQALKPADRKQTFAAGDVLTQLDSIELLHRYRGLSPKAIEATLCAALTALLVS